MRPTMSQPYRNAPVPSSVAPPLRVRYVIIGLALLVIGIPIFGILFVSFPARVIHRIIHLPAIAIDFSITPFPRFGPGFDLNAWMTAVVVDIVRTIVDLSVYASLFSILSGATLSAGGKVLSWVQ